MAEYLPAHGLGTSGNKATLFDAAGVDAVLLPEPRKSTDVLGAITDTAAGANRQYEKVKPIFEKCCHAPVDIYEDMARL